MIGDSDRYNPERAKQVKADLDAWSQYTTMDPYSMPMPPAIGSSSVPFKGDVEHLLKFCNQTIEHCTNENWDGCHVAVNAKSDGEAEVDGTNGLLRLVVATETTRNDCVALLMHPLHFKKIYGSMKFYRDSRLASMEIGEEQAEVYSELDGLRREIRELEKYVLNLQASGPAAIATLRCQERLSELRVRLEDANSRASELKKLEKKEMMKMERVPARVFEDFQEVFDRASLLPVLQIPPHSYTDSEPSPSLEKPINYTYGELPLRSTGKSSSEIFDGDTEDDTQFPSLPKAVLHGHDETPSVDAEAPQSDDKKSPSDSAEEKEGGGESNDTDAIDSGSKSPYESRSRPAPR